MSIRLEDYSYSLPDAQIARFPAQKRDESRLLVLNRRDKSLEHKIFRDVCDYLQPGDCLVVNHSKVFPARLKCFKPTGGKVEVFLLQLPHEVSKNGKKGAETIAISHSSKSLKIGAKVMCGNRLEVEIMEILPEGKVKIALRHDFSNVIEAIENCGEVPLPPYLKRKAMETDKDTYQTVYAKETGSVAAPTAGLHFTQDLMERLKKKGVKLATITLHVGYGTFAPVKVQDIREHKIHSEWVKIGQDALNIIKECKKTGGRVFATGTTTVRALEACQLEKGELAPYEGACDLYIMPGFEFKVVDAIITNFHLPESSLLILVSAFAERKFVLEAYHQALEAGYRFYSYGDAMLIL